MGKDFNDFITYWQNQDMQEVQDSIILELNEYLESNPIEDPVVENIWFTRSFNSKLTMKMLGAYHQWLNE